MSEAYGDLSLLLMVFLYRLQESATCYCTQRSLRGGSLVQKRPWHWMSRGVVGESLSVWEGASFSATNLKNCVYESTYSDSLRSNTTGLFLSSFSSIFSFALLIGRSTRQIPAAFPRAIEPSTGIMVYENV